MLSVFHDLAIVLNLGLLAFNMVVVVMWDEIPLCQAALAAHLILSVEPKVLYFVSKGGESPKAQRVAR